MAQQSSGQASDTGLYLSAEDVQRFEQVAAAFAGHDDGQESEPWRRRVLASLIELVGAERAFWMSPKDPTSGVTMLNHDAAWTPLYVDMSLYQVDEGWARIAQSQRPVFSTREIVGRDSEAFFESALTQDILIPFGMRDTVGLAAVSDGPPRANESLLSCINLQRATPYSVPNERRARMILRLLAPSFTSHIRTEHLLGPQRAHLARTLDALPVAVRLVTARGNVLHDNPALRALLDGFGSADPLAVHLTTVARQVQQHRWLPTVHGGRRLPAPHTSRTAISTARGRFTVSVTLLAGEDPATPLWALVVESTRTRLPTGTELADRFACTPREAETALLLAHGASSEEIARLLGISIHTARRHTEGVFGKLGVRSRGSVFAAIALDP